MIQRTYKEIFEIKCTAREKVSSAIKGELELEELIKAIDELFPEGYYFFNVGDSEKVKKDIFDTMQLDRQIPVPEYPLNACARYKNWEVANYIIEILR